jgi:hypothetical protein
MLGVNFHVVAVSENTNSFGLKQCVLLAMNGLAYKACANSLNLPKQGDSVFIPYQAGPMGIEDATLNFAAKGFEIPERIEDAPEEVIKEVWGTR